MSSSSKCYIKACKLPPVFMCKCQGQLYVCQKHCFAHMGGSCAGKLVPYIEAQNQEKQPQDPESSKFLRLEPSELLSALIPSADPVIQCKICGKLLTKPSESSHICSRFMVSASNINFVRDSIQRYTCSICQQQVHSSLIYPHADFHFLPNSQTASVHDAHLLASLILKTSGSSAASSKACPSSKLLISPPSQKNPDSSLLGTLAMPKKRLREGGSNPANSSE